jgi:hypothetical protein
MAGQSTGRLLNVNHPMNDRFRSRFRPNIAQDNWIVTSVIQMIWFMRPFAEPARVTAFSGQIKSIGPRYCPSIEDKVVKFPDKTRHQLFIEPEGYNTNEVYLNGFSTSLPAQLQQQLVSLIPGLTKLKSFDPAMPSNMTLSIQKSLPRSSKRPISKASFCGSNQRDDRLRGGCLPGTSCRNQCGARALGRPAIQLDRRSRTSAFSSMT